MSITGKEWAEANLNDDDFIVITGSTTGIGLEYLKYFAQTGKNIIAISNDRDDLEKVKEDICRTSTSKITNLCVDLRSEQATIELGKKLAKFPVKVLINNAGIGTKGRFEENSIEKYMEIIKINATAPVIISHAVLPHMQECNAGLVIHVASINALLPIPLNQVYTATKAFCFSFASAVSRENKNSKINFQLVLPGTTDTPFHKRQGVVPQKMVMQPKDVAGFSMQNIERQVCIPNGADRILAKLIHVLPLNYAMDFASYLLKKRLGVKTNDRKAA
jgi:short-subunit dehydrogenase